MKTTRWFLTPMCLLLGLASCTPKPAPIAHDLMLGSKQFAAIASVETVLEASNDPKAPDTTENNELRQLGIQSAGRYRYHLGAPDGGICKVHVLLFTDEAGAVKNWRERHHPEALAATQPLRLNGPGEAWIYPNEGKGEMSSLRVGRAVIEIHARGAATALAPFTRALAAHTAKVLRR